MLKKLQNLLFEDEDDDEEDEEEETEVKEEKQPHTAPVQQPAPAPQPRPATVERPAVQPQTIQRIDVVKPASSVNTQEPKKQSLGITLDDLDEKKEEKKPVKTAPAKKPEVKKPEKKQPVYEFKPVISPIFGVDEKDVNALKTTNQRINRQERQKDREDKNITPIISPMYGPEASSNGARSIDDAAVNSIDDIPDEMPAPSDDLPDFSLDDILKSRDREFEENKNTSPKKKDEPVFPDLEDEPLPDVNKASVKDDEDTKENDFFPDLKFDDDDDNDTTSVIKKPEIDQKLNNKN